MVTLASGQGALTGLTLDEEDVAKRPVVYGVYQTATQTPDMDLSNLQEVYGTAAMPVFDWVRTIQTGTRTYDPKSPNDQEMLKKYKNLVQEQGPPPGLPDWTDVATSIASQVGQMAASQIGASLFDPYLASETAGSQIMSGIGDTFGSTPLQQVQATTSAVFDSISKIPEGSTVFPELANREVAEATGNLDLFNAVSEKGKPVSGSIKAYKAADVNAAKSALDRENISSNLTAEAITSTSPTPSYFDKVGDRLYGTSAAKANWAGAAGAGLVNFGVQLVTGKDPVDAAKSAGASVVGTAVGNALLPGLGGVVGGVLGSVVGGRVICNELCRQGIMTRKQVALDYRFTRDYLTPQHVNGYHVWAVWVVKQMRKGRFIKFWEHVAGHRANEIAHIYGERDKPDYLGKFYRRIFEPSCWVVGAFCKATDWSVLYKTKEI